jgi:tetratricopeptide (TPR) repeat protein
MSSPAEPTGTVEQALAHAVRMLDSQPQITAEQAAEVLKVVPGHPVATLLLAAGRRAMGDATGALPLLEPLVKAHPQWPTPHYELGLVLGALGRGESAIDELRQAVALKPDLPAAWRALGDHLTAIGDATGADAAYAQNIRYSTRDPRLMEAAVHLVEGRIAPAEALLREHLKEHPTDVAAIRMLGEVAARLGRYGDAENLLARCLELAPSFTAARHNYAVVLHRQHKVSEALTEIDRALEAEPRNPGYRNLKAAILSRIGDQDASIKVYADVLADYPRQPKVWMSFGHALKTAGKTKESIDAYRKSIELAPNLGEAYWSLANLKKFRFTEQDVGAMRAQLARTDLQDEDRLHFDFALGKALEDEGEYEESFRHYERGNAIRLDAVGHEADDVTAHMQRSKATLTSEFFAARVGVGCPAPDPIFIVGLPRAGSTLIEQILSSHSQVEGTMELPDVIAMARALGGRKTKRETSKYPEILATLDAADFRALGEQFLANTRIQRKTGTPFFIDKMPNNFAHIGLIHLMLPNAKIIDARRHPLGCCFSNFKQQFARGQNYTYSLEDIGRYYRDYVELMAHFDRVLPGRIHRVFYEATVEDTEGEVRRLLAYCNLAFEPACLKFYENERAVRTASSEQVRSPIYREGLDQWRHFEAWLDPLKAALGPVLAAYPAVPQDLPRGC